MVFIFFSKFWGKVTKCSRSLLRLQFKNTTKYDNRNRESLCVCVCVCVCVRARWSLGWVGGSERFLTLFYNCIISARTLVATIKLHLRLTRNMILEWCHKTYSVLHFEIICRNARACLLWICRFSQSFRKKYHGMVNKEFKTITRSTPLNAYISRTNSRLYHNKSHLSHTFLIGARRLINISKIRGIIPRQSAFELLLFKTRKLE